MRERLACLRAAWWRFIHPPFEDEDPQSTADATAARTAYIRANRPDGEVKT
jgi:hypothetical protein